MLNLTEIKAACEKHERAEAAVNNNCGLGLDSDWIDLLADADYLIIGNATKWVPELVAMVEALQKEVTFWKDGANAAEESYKWAMTQLGIYKAQLKIRDEEQ